MDNSILPEAPFTDNLVLCECGCGRPTNPSKTGFHRFVWGHNARGKLKTPRRIKTLAERFWPKVSKTDSCWLWQASLDGKGYGQINGGRTPTRMMRAHRVAYELVIGPIPDGLDLDHLCRTPRCVNPDHLEPVTRRENTARGDRHKRKGEKK